MMHDGQSFLPNMVSGKEMIWSNSIHLNPHQREETRNPMIGVELDNRFTKMDSIFGEPLLVNLTDEQYNSRDSIAEFLKSRWSELETGGLYSSDASDFMGLHTLQFPAELEAYSPEITTNSEFQDEMNPLVDFVGDMVRSSIITIHPDGRIVLTATGAEIKDIVPIVAEFYLSNTSRTWSKQSAVIPHFSWFDTYGSEFASQNATVVPLDSPEKVKAKRSGKRKSSSRRGSTGRDLHKRNYFHACESLLSLMMNKKHNGRAAMLHTLKKSGPQLPELLTQFSAGIAGTGIAILFTVACKVASGTVPLCTSKLLSTGLGVVMVWLSWAVNKLRDTIISVGRNASKGLHDEAVMISNVDRSLKHVYFRAATLLAVAVLRVA
ncbi:hypothetical protein LINGRAHAP2_LOCUS16294 [Linum grandiflorum]